MVTPSLSPELIAGGQRLLAELDARRVQVDAALWFWVEDRATWRLLLSLPREARGGDLHCARIVVEAIHGCGAHEVTRAGFSVGLLSESVIPSMRRRVRVDAGDPPRRIRGAAFGDCVVHDALVYRMLRPLRRRRAIARTAPRKRAAKKAS